MTSAASLIVDLRCLQDENYRERGVGRHALGLLRHARAQSGFAATHPIIGVTDPALPGLTDEVRTLVDQVRVTGYVPDMRGCRFVQLSPMTHDPLFTARLAGSPDCLAAAVVYDFIPFDFPARYLTDTVRRLDYNAQLAWLSGYDLFMPISQASADRLRALLDVAPADVTVTGAPLDPGFERIAEAAHTHLLNGRHLLVIGGADWRKNVECPVRAHGACDAMRDAGVPLVVIGHYTSAQVVELQRLHLDAGGRPGALRVPGHVSEAALVRFYREAFCVVTASRAEGFSLPVIEAMAVGVPSVASRIPAHRELVGDEALLFEPDDAAGLSALLAHAMQPTWRQAVVARQDSVWPRFRTAEVARLFWAAIEARAERDGPAQSPSRRPRVALLSPVPPDPSGVADYTAACCKELGQRVELHVFTETENPAPIANTVVRPLSALPMVSPEYDRVIGVMGNSSLHTRIFELLTRYGGACICHDARLLGFYRILLGEPRTRAAAERELGRVLEPGELELWLGDEAHLKATFFADLSDTAEPLMFHSRPSVELVGERFGKQALLLPFSIYRPWPEEMLTPVRREDARRRLGLAPAEPLLVTFGFVQPSKGPEECVWALDLLHSWGIRAHLHFVGELAPGPNGTVDLARSLGLEAHVHFHTGYVGEGTYRDYLLGADVAIQLRTHDLGSVSGALLDCVAVGLPAVANSGLAEAIEAPEYVARIPNRLSPVLLAGAIEDLLAAGRPERWKRAWQEFGAKHNFTVYSDRLCDALGLASATT